MEKIWNLSGPSTESVWREQPMEETYDSSEDIQTVALVSDLVQMLGSRCKECAASLCGHQLLMSVVAGYRNSPRCLSCLSRQMGRGSEEVRDHLYHYIMHRACRRAAWLWASNEEGVTALPGCLWSGAGVEGESQREVNPPVSPRRSDPNQVPDAEWDAGNMGCGELVMKLRLRLQAMKPGQILKLRASDDGAPEDLPAWCRLTGHELVSFNHPEYFIQRKE